MKTLMLSCNVQEVNGINKVFIFFKGKGCPLKEGNGVGNTD